ncbi:MAG: copper chaperone PCu(A)C [Alphaproteobacteria bacterium]
MSKKFVVFAALLLGAGAAAAQTGSVAVTDAWARATPSEIAAAYLTLQSPIADRLTGLSTPVAQIAQLHTTSRQGGMTKMSRIAALDLPAGRPIKLEPGATHIMLLGLTEKLRPGQSFPLTLTFEKRDTREVTVNVAKPGATGPEKAGDASTPIPPGH